MWGYCDAMQSVGGEATGFAILLGVIFSYGGEEFV